MGIYFDPQKLASPMCSLALEGCLRPTTDYEILSKDPNLVFKLTRGKLSIMNIFISAHTGNFVIHKLKHPFGVFAQSLRVSSRPKAAHKSLKAHWKCQLLRMPQVIMVDPNTFTILLQY